MATGDLNETLGGSSFYDRQMSHIESSLAIRSRIEGVNIVLGEGVGRIFNSISWTPLLGVIV